MISLLMSRVSAPLRIAEVSLAFPSPAYLGSDGQTLRSDRTWPRVRSQRSFWAPNLCCVARWTGLEIGDIPRIPGMTNSKLRGSADLSDVNFWASLNIGSRLSRTRCLIINYWLRTEYEGTYVSIWAVQGRYFYALHFVSHSACTVQSNCRVFVPLEVEAEASCHLCI